MRLMFVSVCELHSRIFDFCSGLSEEIVEDNKHS